ncbi:hypothetical protein FNW25_06870 [Flavobacterium franklandianum]|uniref:Uncharacterized protein n=1 Tax=Flavobacterium franklandianum TaxID=2594430 RepID=A0A553CT76_9FLAO|nr:hypothetical protein [Flavobacterium franklandianum]TRX23722.1 hypothetical protein FNW17_00665 [Flavobacterium franklandianum]TRX26976.1 hypothetical protein FNW25_06870 [Flavobacterium franklandianum]
MKKIYKLLVFLILLVTILLFVKGYFYKKEIENNKKETVCKFVYCKNAPKTTTSFFKYYVNKKSYRNSYGTCPENYDEKINKFYTIKYSSIDPNKIIVDFSKEIKDTIEILNAGFNSRELKN